MRKINMVAVLAKWGITLDRWQSTKAGKYRIQLGKTVMRVQEKRGNKWVIVFSAYFAHLKVRETAKGTQLGPFEMYGDREKYAWLNLDQIAQ